MKVILYINIITRLAVHPGTEATQPTLHNNLIYFNSEITSRVQVLNNKACGHVFKYKQGSVRTRKWVTFQQLFLNLIFRTISLRLFGFFGLFVWAFFCLFVILNPAFYFVKFRESKDICYENVVLTETMVLTRKDIINVAIFLTVHFHAIENQNVMKS